MNRLLLTIPCFVLLAAIAASAAGDELSHEADISPASYYGHAAADQPAPVYVGEGEEIEASTAVEPQVEKYSDYMAKDSMYPGQAWSGGCQTGYPIYCDPACLTVRTEYLMWWTRRRNLPPLVTTSPDGTGRGDAGIFGLDDTEVLFGDETVGQNLRSGGRVTISQLLDPYGDWFADFRVWGVENGAESFSIESDGSPVIGLPFINATLDAEDALLIAFPGVATNGSVRANIQNELFGADASARVFWNQGCHWETYLLAGYQFTRMDDSLALNSRTTSIDPNSAIPVGTRFDIQDTFRTQNEFHGGQLGFLANYQTDQWSVEVLGKVAIGNMHQSVDIRGRTLVSTGAGPSEGGLLARSSNIGFYTRDRFAFMPELNVTGRYHLDDCWSLTLGYSFLYWNDVLLAANQIDRRVDLGDDDGPPRFQFNRTDYWAQGLSFGVEYLW